MLYLFSGVSRCASIAEFLKVLFSERGAGLDAYEGDIPLEGKDHHLLDKLSQREWLARIGAGDFDMVILSPPCGTWSRASWAKDDGPPPCRDYFHPWGLDGKGLRDFIGRSSKASVKS